jgi:hypothetical protein
MNAKRLLATIFLSLLSMAVLGQDIPLKGNIQDENGKIVPGVNILIKGTPNGTVSDKEGNYSIDVPKGEVVMIFMLIGHKKFEQKFNAQNGRQYMLDVKLIQDLPDNRGLKSYGEMDELKPQ